MLKLLLIQTDLPKEMGAMAAQPDGISMSFIDLAIKGGPVMIPILLLSIIGIYVFVDRYFAIKKAGKFDTGLLEKVKFYITGGKIDSALALCKSTDNPASRMLAKGISRIGRPLTDVNAAIENVGNLEISKLEKVDPQRNHLMEGYKAFRESKIMRCNNKQPNFYTEKVASVFVVNVKLIS